MEARFGWDGIKGEERSLPAGIIFSVYRLVY